MISIMRRLWLVALCLIVIGSSSAALTSSVSGISASKGPAGTVATVNGVNVAAAAAIRLGATSATSSGTSPTRINATAPVGSGINVIPATFFGMNVHGDPVLYPTVSIGNLGKQSAAQWGWI